MPAALEQEVVGVVIKSAEVMKVRRGWVSVVMEAEEHVCSEKGRGVLEARELGVLLDEVFPSEGESRCSLFSEGWFLI